MRALNSSLKYFIVQKLNLSNKDATRCILSGRVLVNGKRGVLAQVLLPEDEVQMDEQVIKVPRKSVYIAYHKPHGIESTMNARIENNILQALDISHDVFPVGRLDKASEGLMLLTNDGQLSLKILHPKSCHEKEYEVTVDHPLTQQAIEQLGAGVVIMGKKTRPAVVRQLSSTTFNIVMTQGLNRQIRRMCYKLGYEVEKLVRIRFITLELGNLSPGEWRYLNQSEISYLLQNVSS
ncbi:ribosomal large subunit pseudouridine synthase F [Flammeovirgaceae bacterium 311]|nr:ribosomal large subunit pseudouridine synthase F [Flammeovirgaceae bacterium 311]